MSKMGEVIFEIDELVEQGMSAKYICAVLKVPYEWAEARIIERNNLELQLQHECVSYDDGENYAC